MLVVTVEAIARRIVSGQVPIGGILPNETDIVEELGVSRTVVREAVRTLVAKGMLRTRRRLGTEVTPVESWSLFDRNVIDWRIRYDPDDKVLDDLVDFVLAVEMIACGRAAEDDSFDRAALKLAFERMEAANTADREELANVEYRFHHTLIDGANNQFCGHVYGVIETALSTFMSPLFLDADSHTEALGDHRTLTEAILRGDAASARGAIERLGHLRRRNLRQALRARRNDAKPRNR
ncbi:FadR/GntR family transcriptional regulator [Acuticoccus sp. I52.16.1]|uniref:FadR/GntR family transcriptional regulator n=1 Tax=Acuticoccus sp. I52.16.1 TaxID=2928472 RepID=UPI001FD2D71D|nr:FCD domain-containing protein [Acuticoccus sp. I52.16.1]UOM35903.1 FCD domain-containing protein [Acuticoccus sp. I52.16.1]